MSKPLLIFILVLLPAVSQPSSWTVACYMVADNNLAPWCREDLEELKSIGTQSGLTIIAQVDWPDSGGKRYLVNPGDLEVVQEFGIMNSGDPFALAEFGSWSFSEYQATHHLLVIWDHGNGWTKGDSEAKGICYDESADDFISISDGELKLALERIMRSVGRKIDIVAFDACLMQMVEVLSEMDGASVFAVGSEQVVPLKGFPYDSILSHVAANPRLIPRELADLMVTEYIRSYVQAGVDVTLSRVDLSAFHDILVASVAFASALRSHPTDPEVRYAREAVQTFSIEYVPPSPRDDHIDYRDFADLLSNSSLPSLAAASSALCTLIDSSTFVQSRGASMQNACGIAVWFPDNYSAFMHSVYGYRHLRFASTTNWEKAVYAYYGVADTVPPTTPHIEPFEIEERNSYTLTWHPSYDLSDVTCYELIELTGVDVSFQDDAESGGDSWGMNGFSLTSGAAHSGSHSYFSQSGELATKEPVLLSGEGRLHFWYRCRMRNGQDYLRVQISSDGTQWSTIDSLSATHEQWTKVERTLHTDSFYLGFSFASDGALDHWVYLDDIQVDSISTVDTLSTQLVSTQYRFSHTPKGIYYYQLRACDPFRNRSGWSELASAHLPDYSPPLAYPNPFQSSTTITYDAPLDVRVLAIYDLTGRRIRTLKTEPGEREVYWDGSDDAGAPVASGVYFCTVDGTTIHKTGKIIVLR